MSTLRLTPFIQLKSPHGRSSSVRALIRSSIAGSSLRMTSVSRRVEPTPETDSALPQTFRRYIRVNFPCSDPKRHRCPLNLRIAATSTVKCRFRYLLRLLTDPTPPFQHFSTPPPPRLGTGL